MVLGFLGLFLLFASVFVPVAEYDITEWVTPVTLTRSTYTSTGRFWIVILLLVLASVPLILKAQFRVLLLTGFLSAFVGVWVLEVRSHASQKRALACAVQRIPRWILGGKQLGLVGSARWCASP